MLENFFFNENERDEIIFPKWKEVHTLTLYFNDICKNNFHKMEINNNAYEFINFQILNFHQTGIYVFDRMMVMF